MGGSLQPQLKLGRNPATPGRLRNSLDPPAGREVQASVTRYGVSPALGMVTRRGDLRMDWVSWKAWRSCGDHTILSFPDFEEGICSSSNFVVRASLAPGRQTWLNRTPPNHPLRPLMVVGVAACQRVQLVAAGCQLALVPMKAKDIGRY